MCHITIDNNNLFTFTDSQAYVLYNLIDNACMNFDNDLDSVSRSDFTHLAFCLRDSVRDSLSFDDRYYITNKYYGGLNNNITRNTS